MQDEEHHKNFGRGRNISCNNFNCSNYRKKISRNRSGWYSNSTLCLICHEPGYVHHYSCTVGEDNVMLCDCHLTSIGDAYISSFDGTKLEMIKLKSVLKPEITLGDLINEPK